MDNEKNKPCERWRGKNYSFFSNSKCEYFPCHNAEKIGEENFNCLFCFCPLYDYEDCGGSYTYLENGNKDCSKCVLPHVRDNYGVIIERLKKKRNSEK